MPRVPSLLIALLIGAAAMSCLVAGGCAPGLPQTEFISCTRPRFEAIEEARSSLVAAGFTIRKFIPDSGYLRTTPKNIQTVNEITSRRPTLIGVEVQHTPAGLNVNAFRVIAVKGSVAEYSGTLHEENADVEEVPLKPGERAHILHIGPFLDHMTEYCAAK